MKIDIHTHTKKCKSGDAATREITAEKFCETISATEVKIVAITNHNHFDLQQYQEIASKIPSGIQVWPGIELDVMEGGSRAHLLVIVSPKKVKSFAKSVDALINGRDADEFTASIDEILTSFDTFKPLYIAHYNQKKPNISEEALEKLAGTVRPPRLIIKEVTNAISAGIYISHGHASIYGSDVHDWSTYEAKAHHLPDLRLPVDSFEHFCLLLEKDPTTINTALNAKISEQINLVLFEGVFLTIKAYNDITVIFGSKGTGKTRILEAIAGHYSSNGIDAKVYKSASDRLDDLYDVKGVHLTIDLDECGIKLCNEEIEHLRTAKENDVTAPSKYKLHFETESTNKNAQKLLIKDIEPEDYSLAEGEFGEFYGAINITDEFLHFLEDDPAVKKELNGKEHADVKKILSDLVGRLIGRAWSSYSQWKEIVLLNTAIETFRTQIQRKTGNPAKPTTTGFLEYAKNRIQIHAAATAIINSVEIRLEDQMEYVGNLSANKGNLYFKTEIKFQDGNITDKELLSLSDAKKSAQKKFVSCVRKIRSHAFSDELFQKIAEFNAIDDGESIESVYNLLLFKRCFVIDGQPYTPSSGESSMVMLQKELGTERDVYILDEPERSLGNEYINDVIVPLIRGHARAGKKVFISTHDANIAVRTLPYNSIYRLHGSTGYTTYIGNPFSNNLVNPNDEADVLDWKQISMKTLEGGEDAFGERGRIYGNS